MPSAPSAHCHHFPLTTFRFSILAPWSSFCVLLYSGSIQDKKRTQHFTTRSFISSAAFSQTLRGSRSGGRDDISGEVIRTLCCHLSSSWTWVIGPERRQDYDDNNSSSLYPMPMACWTLCWCFIYVYILLNHTVASQGKPHLDSVGEEIQVPKPVQGHNAEIYLSLSGLFR